MSEMEFVRTPDERFANLPQYPFAPHYVPVPCAAGTTLRMHYVDEGSREGRIALLLHGEPTWSFLYRNVIPPLLAAGLRAIAPDLIGFGRSDKPVRREDYTYQRHVDWVRAFVESLDLREAVLVGQDWGGLIGLRIVAEMGDRFAGVVAANTFLPTGDSPPNEAFLRWQAYAQRSADFSAGAIVARTCVTPIAPEVVAAYDAPFPDERYKAGARQFPMLVPIRPDDPAAAPNRNAWEALRRWHKPFVTAFSDGDPITRGAEGVLQQEIPGALGRHHPTIVGASHFLQEDKPTELAAAILTAFV
jgi:haloalkane dehalogenase